MILHLEEFRCPQFRIKHDGKSHLLFWPGDTVGERIDPEFAISMALTKLDMAQRDPIFERRMLPATKKYRTTVTTGPAHFDGEA